MSVKNEQWDSFSVADRMTCRCICACCDLMALSLSLFGSCSLSGSHAVCLSVCTVERFMGNRSLWQRVKRIICRGIQGSVHYSSSDYSISQSPASDLDDKNTNYKIALKKLIFCYVIEQCFFILCYFFVPCVLLLGCHNMLKKKSHVQLTC